MNKNKPLDHVRSTGVNVPSRTSKLVNKYGVQFYVPKLTRIIECPGTQNHPIRR